MNFPQNAALAELLGVQTMDEVTVIRWNPPSIPPENDRYVLLRYEDREVGLLVIDLVAYVDGAFELRGEDGVWVKISPELIRGWAYPVYQRL